MAANSNSPRVLLGVTGGIAAYKSPEIVRRLVERGCEVQVVMSAGAGRFVSPLTFQAVSGRRVRDELWDPMAEAAMGHIELARWADVVLVAPATAHFLGTLAGGLAGDLLSTVCLATTAPIVLAPAMNQAMWANPAVQANRALLEARGVRFLGPAEGDQACGETGPGRMTEPSAIAEALAEAPGRLRLQSLKGLKVMITAGPDSRADRSRPLHHESELRKDGVRARDGGARGRRSRLARERARGLADPGRRAAHRRGDGRADVPHRPCRDRGHRYLHRLRGRGGLPARSRRPVRRSSAAPRR